MTSPSDLPTAAEEGFKDAAAYDTHRPNYPPEAVEAFLQTLQIAGQDETVNIVEVASGTGKFTELLAARPERYSVKAIEPHGPMRDKLAHKDLPGVEVLDGKADKMPVEEEWGDACIAAQAFHWFATPEALKEIHRVLRPGAVFGMIWNIDEYNKPRDWPATTKWEQKLNDYILGFDDGLPRFRHQKWQEVFERQAPASPLQAIRNTFADHLPRFSLPLGENTVKWTMWLSEEALWARINTLSQIAVLKGEEREAAIKKFKEILQGNDVERNGKGEITIHGVTYFAWTDRL
ncbi:S-adenosyl-L-methionine-dependent methyltransferase [Xylaria telfairii]|nr:S-adenosyl-L-methionine-dependent methyltransferase [Xylaria telfairii]